MIRSFRDRHTEAVYLGERVRRFQAFSDQAQRKLQMLDTARSLADLAAIPGNRLEALRGDRKGRHSIRINDRFRVCFLWNRGDAYEVEVTDYH